MPCLIETNSLIPCSNHDICLASRQVSGAKPLTEPYEKDAVSYNNLTGLRSFYHTQRGVRGDHKTPYNYGMCKEKVTGLIFSNLSGGWTMWNAGNSPGGFIYPDSEYQALYNRLYARIMNQAKGTSAQLGATIGEYSSSARMIRSRGEQLANLADNVRKIWTRKRKKSKKFRNRYKTCADLWLEYSFGWAPLLGDLWSGLNRMSQPPPQNIAVYAKGKISYEFGLDRPGDGYSGSLTLTVVMFGDVKITNPNVALLADLGLMNPAAIAWELMPWSFVADWMFDISSMIGSWSDNFGRDFGHTGMSRVQKGSITMTGLIGQEGASTCESVFSRRSIGGLASPLPNLALLKNIGSSMTRAANAIALAVQIITKPRGRR